MSKKAPIRRQTVDLSAYPDLVVIYLGMRAPSLKAVGALAKTGKEITAAVQAQPDGLLLHETFLFSLLPPHLGMRQYWRDLDCLERWTREGLHRGWWTSFLKDPKGTSFWHETYRRSGGFEAIYDNVTEPVGMMRFAPVSQAKGPTFSARARLDPGSSAPQAPVSETELERT
jgi:hypothetical protein